MPSAGTLELARPRCWRRVIERHGQHGVHLTCYAPMRYHAASNTWECPACGGLAPGPTVAARSSAQAA